MIRLKNIDKDIMASVLSCMLYKETTKETYVFYNYLKTILDTTEVIDEVYLVYSALDTLHDLYAIRRDVPAINKELIMTIIKDMLEEEIKSVYDPGFRTYARTYLGVELDPLNDQSVLNVATHVYSRCDEFLDALAIKGLTVDESLGFVPSLMQNYVDQLTEEASQIIIHLNNNDKKILDYQFIGWKNFMRKHRLFERSDLPKLMRLVASIIEDKYMIAEKTSKPLDSIGRLVALKEKYIVYDTPIGYWGVGMLDHHVRVVPGTYTLIVGERGSGKTTLGAWMAANIMEQGKKVMFYCPEIAEHMLLFTNILPAFIKAKYDFLVNVEQILGREPLFPVHDYLSVKERQDLLRAAELSLAESKQFFHITSQFSSSTILDELRSAIIKFEPDVIIFDHTTEVHGEQNLNIVTQNVASAIETIKKEFFVHVIAFSHTGSDFKKPSRDRPIITSKICNWSARLEAVADNVLGMFRDGDDLNIFSTKSRWAPPFPMWITLQMDRPCNWFEFIKTKQVGSRLSAEALGAFNDTTPAVTLMQEEDEDDTVLFDPDM